MNKLSLTSLKREKDFMKIQEKNFTLVFTNAELERSFNRNTEQGLQELNSLKHEFEVDKVVYLKQIHSDKILNYDKNKEVNINDKEGDAIITNEKNIIIGVFTADCVPIILVDEVKGISAAIHSGWRGTFESITLKTIEKMKLEFGSNEKEIKAYIGPHIKKCCYEVSQDLKDKFIDKKRSISKEELFNERNLNLESCILDDLRKGGLSEDNINSLDLCTYCSKDIKLHSYRKSEGAYGRMLSFIILH